MLILFDHSTPAVVPEFKQGQLLRCRVSLPLVGAHLENVAPEIALALDVDEAKSAHGHTSPLAREKDRVVFKPQRHFRCRKISELQLLGVDDLAIAVFAGEPGCAVGSDRELPRLKPRGGDAFVRSLKKGDGIEKPVSSSLVGNVFPTVGKRDSGVQGMRVPMLAAGEVPEIGFGKFRGLRHGLPPF
jgi:hypothetical protein